MGGPLDQFLLVSSGIVLLANSFRSPTRDRTAVASASFLGLVLGLAAQLPSHGWYVFSMIILIINYPVVVVGVLTFFMIAPALCTDPDIKWHIYAIYDDDKRRAFAMGIWSADIWAIWSLTRWLQSLPSDTHVPALIATTFCPILEWHYQGGIGPDPQGLDFNFRAEPSRLLMIESFVGFVGLTVAIAYSLYQCIRRRKTVTPEPSLPSV